MPACLLCKMANIKQISLFIFTWIIHSFLFTHFVSSRCLNDQKSLLLELKNNLTFAPEALDKLVGWNHSIDCCRWSGVKCDNSNGQVIGLDLSGKDIIGGISSSCSLFHLQFLQSLNLANNYDLQGEIPSTIGKLSSLTYLNLSEVGFSGQVPVGISQLVKLVVLDVSKQYAMGKGLYLKNPNLAMLIQNLTSIRELYLDNVNISTTSKKWCKALSSSLPHLQVLSMSGCDLRGEIHKSLLNLQHLSVIRLDLNPLASSVPEFLVGFTNLTKLSLSDCGLTKTVPRSIFQVPTLITLDLSMNNNLQGTLPTFYKNGSLEELILGSTNFSGYLPSSISNLKRLRNINLYDCQFNGSIPSSMKSLHLLEDVDLSLNYFSGSIQSFSSAKNLKSLALWDNLLSGSIDELDWNSLLNLEKLDLSENSLNGSIPTTLFNLPSLQLIYLQDNEFSGQLNEFESIASSKISTLDISGNNLEGPIPKSIFQLTALENLDLSSNRFNGTLKLAEFRHSFMNLSKLQLSFNHLSIDTNVNSSFPQLQVLALASCNLHIIPKFLMNQSLGYLDLSINHITGVVPEWMWGILSGGDITLNLSSNHFVGLHPPRTLSNTSKSSPFPNTLTLDLHSNNLQGNFPIVSSNLKYLEFSSNNFSSIDPNIGNYLSQANFLSFSKNELNGSIPTALCNAPNLEFLNLEYNLLSGKIPDCLIAMTQLIVLNLGGNYLEGAIPNKFRRGCSLQTLHMNGNFLQGQIPRSLANCKALQVLDLGNNRLYDTLPCYLKSLSDLKVLVLRSNNFHGTMACLESPSIWPLLQIVDLASNFFRNELTALMILKWTSMMASTTKVETKPSYVQSNVSFTYYQNFVTINFKGLSYELQYILITFTSIDFSNNSFHGELPRELGNLNALVVLNLSHNSFWGHIPSSFGNLSQVESLDLSCNALTGKIPTELENLNFLSYLNLSFNKLSGVIPTSTQLQSFEASSYEGNPGLFGPPLTEPGPRATPPTCSEGSNWSSKNEIEWMLMGAEVGFPVGITIFIGPLLYIKRYREWYCKHLYRLVMKIICKEDKSARGRRRRRRRRNQQRQMR